MKARGRVPEPDTEVGVSETLSFGRALRECREAAGLSQAQVAEGVYGTANLAALISDLEAGRIDPVSLGLLLRMADVLGVSLAEVAARAWGRVH
ncbi:helix-turn-helix domain-containing protein [Deinococcus budaensis]|uniref:Transcriptional regulator with XRE-family HTH domain n=1 Tax=Deinococcus budaensis TaxID=1665626 RepID=A0A7W8LNQ4_9DEIO|nr:transcriptional regulator with XRE-family HTH domain [Deinococcus budaensis]